jgi:hypothetical protein
MSQSPTEDWCTMNLHRNSATTRHGMERLRRPRQRGAGGFLSKRRRATIALLTAAVMPAAFALQLGAMSAPAAGAPAATGNGFVVSPGDLTFVLKQIKISERHATTLTASEPCGTLVNRPGDNIPDAEQVPDILTAYGLRTVDGSCNNLKSASTRNFAAADQVFPRLTTPVFRDADPITPAIPVGPPGPTSYKQKQGNVVDAQPRVISNLIVDQTSTNPAAIAAAGRPVRSQDPTATAVPCTTDPDPTAHHGPGPHGEPTDRPRPGQLHAQPPDPVHPEHHHRRGSLPAVQQPVHLLRTVLRPRRRPDRQERQQRVRPAAG